MNHFCSTVDSIDPDCLPNQTTEFESHEASARLELPIGVSGSTAQIKTPLLRSPFYRLLDQFDSGAVTVSDGFETKRFGARECTPGDLRAHVVIGDPATYRRVMLGSMLGAAESYIDGQWASDDLTSLVRIMIRNLDAIHKVDRTWSRAKNAWNWIRHLLRRNTIEGSRRNIHEHYDLGNNFYQLFLDPTLSYSSAIFNSDLSMNEPFDQADLKRASIHKMNVVCEKLDVQPTDHVLEIGTGWGGMAIHLASTTGCRVTTTTISKEQYRHAVQRVADAGLSDRVTVLDRDYRRLEGEYDKLVSIEMIEAVGHQYFDQFFSTCSDLLRPGGRMLIQSILIAGQHYHDYIRRTDFIRRYIFPGGCLPSISALQKSVDRVTNFQMTALDDYSLDYAVTLKLWRRAFMDKLNDVRRLGYDEKFIRLWHFYLCYCEAAFRERRTNLAQMVFEKPCAGRT